MDRGRVPQLPDWTDGVPPGVTVELLRIQKSSTTSFDVSNSLPVGCIFGHEKHDATLRRTHEAQLDGNDHGGSSSVQWLLGGHGCGNMPGLGARANAGRTKTIQKGPVYGVSGGGAHSLATPVEWTLSPTNPLGVAPRAPILIGRQDTPLAELGIFGFGVKEPLSADIRRLGLRGYPRNWAELGLGISLADISRDPSTICTFVKFNIFSRGGGSLLLY